MLRPRDTATRECRSLDGLWQFALDADGVGRDQGWWNGPLAGAREVPVPASCNDLFADARVRNHVGDVWYQTLVRVPARWAGERIVLHFDAATHGAVAWWTARRSPGTRAASSPSPEALAPGRSRPPGIACYGVLYFGMGLINTLIFAIQPDTVDYGEWKTGVRGKGSATRCSPSPARWARASGGRGLVHHRARGLRPARPPGPARRSPRSRWPSASSPPWPS